MTWMIGSLLAAMFAAAGGILYFVRKEVKRMGAIEKELEQALEEAEDAKRANRIQNQPDVAWSDYIKRLRDKYEK